MATMSKFLRLHPLAPGDKLVFQQSGHGIATAEGEQTDFQHGQKECAEFFHISPPFGKMRILYLCVRINAILPAVCLQ
jgi:hypothetical protein